MIDAVRTLSPPAWMESQDTKRVIEILNGQEKDPSALFVGGCVRNWIMKKIVDDIDIATTFPPEQTTAILQQAGIKVVPTGIDHGTVTAVTDTKTFEITTLRRDVETFGRHAIVAYTEDWGEDAQRRDFTMNTLLADLQGNIYDPTSRGLADLEAGAVIFVGDPAQRIAEDYLRILRFFRFYAFYGKGEPDKAALAACKEAASHITDLSRERITQEFLKILGADNAATILLLIFECGIMTDIIGSSYDAAVLGRVIKQQGDIVCRLAAVSSDMERLEKYLVLSNAQKKQYETIFKALGNISGEKAIKISIYRYGVTAVIQALLLNAAIENRDADLSLAKNWQVPAFPLSGADLLLQGLPSGPDVGRILGQVELWWIERDFSPDHAACIEQAKTLIEQ